jgi:hypothetical protein
VPPEETRTPRGLILSQTVICPCAGAFRARRLTSVSKTFWSFSVRHRSGTGTYGVAATFNVPLGITLIAKTPKFQGFSSTMRNYEDGAGQLGKLPFCH